jgi:GAF domain-containing protein
MVELEMDYFEAEKDITKIIKENKNLLDSIVEYLYENFDHYSWIGLYVVKDNELVLGPWRGKQATEHTKIPIGMGVCGSAAKSGKTEIVPDVGKDNRYLACFLSTKSEIVVPIKHRGIILGEIDIDSDNINAFDEKDKIFLEKIADMLGPHIC